MKTMLHILETQLQAGRTLVLAAIVDTIGPTSRASGTFMLTGEEGILWGTVGGGIAEHRAVLTARSLLQTGGPQLCWFRVNENDTENPGKIQVFFTRLSPDDPQLPVLIQEARRRMTLDEAVWLLLDLQHGTLGLSDAAGSVWGDTAALPPDQKPGQAPMRLQTADTDLLLLPLHSTEKVYLLGGGHVARELQPLLTHLGFRCIVLEDREEFAQPALFPTAEQVLLVDFEQLSSYVTITEEDYVCIMTRGHAWDLALQAQILQQHPLYAGIIGSRSRAIRDRQALQADFGLSEAEFAPVHSPIGLSIDASTPTEIAVSIAAQMIQIRAAKTRCSQ